MSTWHDEVTAGFNASLEMLQNSEDGSCLFQWPLKPDRTPLYPNRFIDCVSSVSPDALTLVAGGMLNDYQFTMTCRKADFDTLPVIGTLFLKNGRVSRILTIDTNDISPLVLFHCGTPDK